MLYCSEVVTVGRSIPRCDLLLLVQCCGLNVNLISPFIHYSTPVGV